MQFVQPFLFSDFGVKIQCVAFFVERWESDIIKFDKFGDVAFLPIIQFNRVNGVVG